MEERTVTVNKCCAICEHHRTLKCPFNDNFESVYYTLEEKSKEYGLYCNKFELDYNFTKKCYQTAQ